MSIRLECSNGHKLKAKDNYGGRNTTCPKCGTKVHVPTPERRPISDSSVLAILSDRDGGATTVTHLAPPHASPTKKCPRCKTPMPFESPFCPLCDCFVS